MPTIVLRITILDHVEVLFCSTFFDLNLHLTWLGFANLAHEFDFVLYFVALKVLALMFCSVCKVRFSSFSLIFDVIFMIKVVLIFEVVHISTRCPKKKGCIKFSIFSKTHRHEIGQIYMDKMHT